MRILELVALLSSPNKSHRDRAGVELCAIIRALCARRNTPPRSCTPVLIPPQWREDVAQDVLLRLAEDGAAIVARMQGGDDAAESYVRRMIAARYLTLVRRMRGVRDVDPARIAAPVPVAAEANVDRELDRGRSVVEAVLDRLAAPAEVRRTYGEMEALAAERVTMVQCIERELGGAYTHATFRTARNRLQQRHRRLRVTLLEAIEQLARDGALDPDDAQAGARFVEHVLNRAPKRRAVSDQRAPRVGSTCSSHCTAPAPSAALAALAPHWPASAEECACSRGTTSVSVAGEAFSTPSPPAEWRRSVEEA